MREANRPVVIVNRSPQGLPAEGDCACPASAPVPAAQRAGPAARYATIVPAHAQRLPAGLAAFLPENGSRGVVVLSEPARAVLDAFHFPATASEKGLLPRESAILPALVRTGLLAQVDCPARLREEAPDQLTAWLSLTEACNLSCDYCYVRKNASRMSVETGRRAIEAVVRSAAANGFKRIKLKYSGGEATLNFPVLLAIQRHALALAGRHGLGLDGVVLSNGVGLTDEMIADLRSAGLRLSISLDGLGAAHDAQRKFRDGRGSFAAVERSLDRLLRIGLIPSITVTVTSRNMGALPELTGYLLDRVLPFSFNFCRETDSAAGEAGLRYRDQDMIAALRAAFQVIESRLPDYSVLGMLLDRVRLDYAHERPCGAGESYLVIDPRGRVARCQMETEQPVSDISAQDPLAEVRLSALGVRNPAVDEKGECRACPYRYYCAGGCPSAAYRAYGDYTRRSPNCEIYRTLIPELVRLEGMRLLRHGVEIQSA